MRSTNPENRRDEPERFHGDLSVDPEGLPLARGAA